MNKNLCNEDIHRLDVNEVENFLKQGGHPDNNTKPGHDSPLCFACMYDRVEIAKVLINAGADVNFRGAYGRTPFMYAIAKGNLELGELLLAKGADINALNEANDNILMDILSYSSPEAVRTTVQWLIAKGIDIHYKNQSQNDTVLSRAVQYGGFDKVKLLIESGADGAKNGWHEKSFMASLKNPTDDLAFFFLSNYKGPVNALDEFGHSALVVAVEYNKPRIAKMLLERESKDEAGKRLNDKHFTKMICDAAYKGNAELCKLILDAGANVNAAHYTTSALQTASSYNHPEVVKLLIDHGADIEHKDYAGNTALNLAAAEGRIETVKLLVEAGANIHTKNSGGWTPLMHACLQGRAETVQFFLEKGANANDKAENERNITALMLAADAGSVDKIKLLLEFGADPFAKDDVDLTAHDYARFAMQTNYLNDTKHWQNVMELLPAVPINNQPKQYNKVALSECPVCKGIKDYEDAKVSGWDSDYRKYFFRVMNCLSEGNEIHEEYKFYSRTSVYECPRCGSFYKKRVTQDFDNTYVEYELSVNRISKGEADYLVQQISEKKL